MNGYAIMLRLICAAAAHCYLKSDDPDFTVEQEITCIAENINREARGEPALGRIAVAAVTLIAVSSTPATGLPRISKPPKSFENYSANS